ncbi:MAG: flagellar export chaperone FliS [Polyangia bacterium]
MSAAHRYADVRNTTASKERLMVMLFEAALRHMRTAARHLEHKDRKAAAPLIEKACQIVLELQSTLKPEVAPKLTQSLIEIYTFTAARLCRANITGQVKDLRDAEKAFAPIVDGFVQAVAALGPNGAPAAALPVAQAADRGASGTRPSAPNPIASTRTGGPTAGAPGKVASAPLVAVASPPVSSAQPAKAPVVVSGLVASRYPRVAR